MPHQTRQLLMRGLGIEPADVYEISGMLDLTALNAIADLDIPEPARRALAAGHPGAIRDRPIPTRRPMSSRPCATATSSSTTPTNHSPPSVQHFIEQAAEDPDVLTIKQTLYRTSGDSPIVKALIQAAELGKQVVVLVELKARFDEQANIVWARALERAGAHVAYGLLGLKTHSQARPCRPTRGPWAAPLRSHRHRQLQPEDGAHLRRPGTVHGRSGTWRGRDRAVQPAHRALAPDALPEAAGGADDAARRPGRADRRRGGAPRRARRRADRGQVQLDRRPGDHCRALSGQRTRRSDRPDRARHVLGPARSRGRQRVDPRALDRRPLPRALAHLRLRQRRARAGSTSARPTSWSATSTAASRRSRRSTTRPARHACGAIIDAMLADDRRAWQLDSDDRWRRIEEIVDQPSGLDTFEIMMMSAQAASAATS